MEGCANIIIHYPHCSLQLTDWSYMLPCLSEDEEDVDGDGDGALGNALSVGVMPGLPRPEELELLERCGPWPGPIIGAGRTGLTGGGLKGALGLRVERAGLKVVMVSEEELLLLRRWAASGSLITMVCWGLADISWAALGCLRGSRVSRTTSGACLATFCLSNSRNSCRAVFMVFSMSSASASASRALWSPKLACLVVLGDDR